MSKAHRLGENQVRQFPPAEGHEQLVTWRAVATASQLCALASLTEIFPEMGELN